MTGIVTGRRLVWLLIAGWLVVAGALSPLQTKLPGVENNDNAAFLPAGAESTEVGRVLRDRFPGGQSVPALLVYQRPGGLAGSDWTAIADDARRAGQVAGAGTPVVPAPSGDHKPGGAGGLVSADRSVAVVVLPVSAGAGPQVRDTVAAVRKVLHPPGGVRVYVTGPAGISADAITVFTSVDVRLLVATILLVLVVLLLIYRSPLLALVPLACVAFAYVLAAALVYLLARRAGLLVNSQATSLMLILMFGAGTDYSLLLVARYREELREEPDKRVAMRAALRGAGPSILSSGLTVIAALGVLLVAKLGSTRVLGPVGAIGLGCVLLSTFTLLPALLTVLGRHAFWPFTGQVEYRPGHAPRAAETGAAGWTRIGRAVLARPVRAGVLVLLLFGIGAAGTTRYVADVDLLHAFRASTDSATGYDVLRANFPAGTLAPTTVVLERGNGTLSRADLAAAASTIRQLPGIAAVNPQGSSTDGRAAQLSVAFTDDPYDQAGLQRVADLRAALDTGLPAGVRALVGGDPAVQFDGQLAAERDLRLVVPITLAVILLILVLLLRALVAPLYLIATVIVSFFGAFGLSVAVFRDVLGQPGVHPVEPTFAFVFLVALGVDYNIFLMARVREEAKRRGTRDGTLAGLVATGGVITSAGVVLAGTFAVLMTLPLTMLFQLGFTVAVGVLLDTFLVRTVLVPAITSLLGDRAWWPGRVRAVAPAHLLSPVDVHPPAETSGEIR
jgi:RND superfamily putative drug exporter